MASRNSDYRSPAILSFLKRSGKVDPEEAVKAEATKLLADASLQNPPFDPKRVAALRKVLSLKGAEGEATSQLVPIKGGFIIRLKRGGLRDAFSIAHEIGHTLFYSTESEIPARLQLDPGSDAEEKLCNIFAAELLMPEPKFRSDAHSVFGKTNSWCETLFQLKEQYRVSMRALVQRFAELGVADPAIFIRWSWKAKPSDKSDFKLRVDWSIPLQNGKHYFVWPGEPAPSDSAFVRASLEGSLVRGESKLKLGILKGDFIIEAKGYRGDNFEEGGGGGKPPKPVVSIVWCKK